MAHLTNLPDVLAGSAHGNRAGRSLACGDFCGQLGKAIGRAGSSLAAVALGVACLALGGPAQADTVQYFHDPVGRLSTVIDPAHGNVQYIYDAVGNMTAVNTSAVGSVVVGQVSPIRAAPGTVVTISGAGFGTLANTTVTFNGVAATPTAVTASQVTVAVPATATSGPVRVVAPAGAAALPFDFKVDASAVAPTISSFSPTTVAVGGSVTIQGTGFDAVLSNDKVSVNGQFVDLKSGSATSLVIGPMPFLGSGRISVGTPGGAAVSGSYLVVPPTPYAVADLSGSVAAPLGAAKTLSIAKAGQVALAMFDLTTPSNIAARKTGASTIDGDVYLIDPAGARLARTSGSTNLILDPTQLKAPGTYTILFVPYDSSATGSFQFTPFLVPPDANANITANGPAVSLTTTTLGQNMAYTFNATTGQRFSVLAQVDANITNACFDMVVLQPDGLTELNRNLFCSSQGFSDVFIAPEAGPYTIKIVPHDYILGTASARLYAVPADATASAATNGALVSLTTTAPGQNMALTFAAAANQRISALVQTDANITNQCYDYAILLPSGQTLYSSLANCGASAFSDLQIAPVAGTYKVYLNPGGTVTGRADFKVYTVAADVTGTVTLNGASISLATTTPGQNMKVTFTATALQKVNFSVTPDANLSNSCFDFTVLKPDGKTQLFNTSACGASSTGLITAPTAGTYTAVIHAANAGIGSASFKLTSSAAISAAGARISVQAPAETASGLTLSVNAPGRSAKSTFQASAGQRLGLLVRADSALGAQCFTTTLIGPDGASQLYRNLSCSGEDFIIAPSPPKVPTTTIPVLTQTGTYTLVLEPGGQAIGNASVEVSTIPSDAVGQLAMAGAPVSLTTTMPGQAVRATFNGNANQSAKVNLGFSRQSPTNACFAITVLEPDGRTVLSGSLACGDGYTTGSMRLPATGQYTVVASPSGTTIATTSMSLVAP